MSVKFQDNVAVSHVLFLNFYFFFFVSVTEANARQLINAFLYAVFNTHSCR